jgi:large subunit ribosomal protein LP1
MAFLAQNKEEFVTCMAALVLQDSDVELNSDNMNALIKNSGNTVAPYWPSLFSGMFANNNCEKLIWTGSKGAGGAAVAAAGAAGAAPAAEAAAPVKAKEEEVDPMEGGMSMFGGGDGGDY